MTTVNVTASMSMTEKRIYDSSRFLYFNLYRVTVSFNLSYCIRSFRDDDGLITKTQGNVIGICVNCGDLAFFVQIQEK